MTALQLKLDTGRRGVILIEDRPGVVVLRIMDRLGKTETSRLEFTPLEADNVAGHLLSAAWSATVRNKESEP